jgi:hypothetical protein
MYSMQAMDMPISKPTEPAPAASNPQAYQAERAAFKARHVSDPGIAGAVQAFHAVRNLPYFSGPDRTPLAALRNGRGACTAKHMLLRDLLRDLGYRADVELVDCDFAAAVAPGAGNAGRIARLCAHGGSPRHSLLGAAASWRAGRSAGRHMARQPCHAWFCRERRLDRSRRNRPGGQGHRAGHGRGCSGKKAELLAELAPEETQRRKAFLGVLSAWLEEMSVGHEGGTT